MTIYNLSKKDRATIGAIAHFCNNNSKSSIKLWAVNWLAWYRLYYRKNDRIGMKRNIQYFLEEIRSITKGEQA